MRKLSIFDNIINDKFKLFYLNTNTSLDLATGKFMEGIPSDKYFNKTEQSYLNGGISPTLAIVGKSQQYKSTLLLSYLSRILRLYKDSSALVYDTEYAIAGRDRILDVGNELDDYNNVDRLELKKSIRLYDKRKMSMEGLYTTLRETVKERIKHSKDYIVESPFLDPFTKKPILTMIPFIALIDSFSMMSSIDEDELFDKHELSASETNMVFMNDARTKTKFMRQVPSISSNGGIHIMVSAHLGKKFNLTPFGDKSKELQYMKQDDTIKNVGTQFGFLTNTLLEAYSAKLIQDKDKKCQYVSKFGSSTPTELNQVSLKICRCKNNVSGVIINPILSQYFGIQSGLSSFDAIVKSKQGIIGTTNKKFALYDKLTITRQKLRSFLSDDYEFYRALEIVEQLNFIAVFWMLSTPTLQLLHKKTMDDIVNLLIKNDRIKISDILNSRGYWTYDKKEKRPYLSIIDILDLLIEPSHGSLAL